MLGREVGRRFFAGGPAFSRAEVARRSSVFSRTGGGFLCTVFLLTRTYSFSGKGLSLALMGDLHQRHKSESVSGMAEQVGQRLTSAIEGPVFALNRCMLLGERLGGWVDTGKKM